MACFCEYGYEALGFVKGRIDQMCDYKFLRKSLFHYFVYSLQREKQQAKLPTGKFLMKENGRPTARRNKLAWRGLGLG